MEFACLPFKKFCRFHCLLITFGNPFKIKVSTSQMRILPQFSNEIRLVLMTRKPTL